MKFADEPKAIQKALLAVTKFGFIRKQTFWNFLTKPNVSYKYDLWNRLMSSGCLAEYNRVGISENYYGLSKKGVRLMCDLGYRPVARTHPLHFEHDEIILNFALAGEKNGLIKDSWLSEQTARQLSSAEQIKMTGSMLDKIPDLLFEANVDKVSVLCALEVERTRKSKVRYDSFVLSYARHEGIELIIVAYKDEYTKRSILESIRRMGYPQDKRPIAFCKISEIINTPINFELNINSTKINFDKYIGNLRVIATTQPEKPPETNSGKNSGNSMVAA